MTDEETGTLAHEFPDYDASTLPAIPEGFEDAHWHNETCPHWTRPFEPGHRSGRELDLWANYPNPSDREVPGSLRYLLRYLPTGEQEGSLTLEYTDDWAEILYALDHLEARILAAQFVALIGLGFHPDTRGRDYTRRDGTRCFTDAEADLYDAEIERLFSLGGDPYAHGLAAMRGAGLLETSP